MPPLEMVVRHRAGHELCLQSVSPEVDPDLTAGVYMGAHPRKHGQRRGSETGREEASGGCITPGGS